MDCKDQEQDIVKVIDQGAFLTEIAWQQGTLSSGSKAKLSTLWIFRSVGDYQDIRLERNLE